MTFTSEVKKEISRLPTDRSLCPLAELAAFMRLNGVLNLSGGKGFGVSMRTENAAVARRMFKLIREYSFLSVQVLTRSNKRFQKRRTYIVRIDPQQETADFLRELGLMAADYSIIPGIAEEFRSNSACRRAYLRACFLASGAVSDPEKGDYHCEISTHDEIHLEHLLKLSAREGLDWRPLQKKSRVMLYLKDSRKITEFLAMIGASSASLEFENALVYREMRNRVNRLVNSETANLNKTMRASLEQRSNIQIVDEMIGLDELPPDMQLVAQVRIDNPEDSLSELAEKLPGQWNKSKVNTVLRKFAKMAEDFRI